MASGHLAGCGSGRPGRGYGRVDGGVGTGHGGCLWSDGFPRRGRDAQRGEFKEMEAAFDIDFVMAADEQAKAALFPSGEPRPKDADLQDLLLKAISDNANEVAVEHTALVAGGSYPMARALFTHQGCRKRPGEPAGALRYSRLRSSLDTLLPDRTRRPRRIPAPLRPECPEFAGPIALAARIHELNAVGRAHPLQPRKVKYGTGSPPWLCTSPRPPSVCLVPQPAHEIEPHHDHREGEQRLAARIDDGLLCIASIRPSASLSRSSKAVRCSLLLPGDRPAASVRSRRSSRQKDAASRHVIRTLFRQDWRENAVRRVQLTSWKEGVRMESRSGLSADGRRLLPGLLLILALLGGCLPASARLPSPEPAAAASSPASSVNVPEKLSEAEERTLSSSGAYRRLPPVYDGLSCPLQACDFSAYPRRRRTPGPAHCSPLLQIRRGAYMAGTLIGPTVRQCCSSRIHRMVSLQFRWSISPIWWAHQPISTPCITACQKICVTCSTRRIFHSTA